MWGGGLGLKGPKVTVLLQHYGSHLQDVVALSDFRPVLLLQRPHVSLALCHNLLAVGHGQAGRQACGQAGIG